MNGHKEATNVMDVQGLINYWFSPSDREREKLRSPEETDVN